MKLTVLQIERMTGTSRTKVYNDIEDGTVTAEKNEKGKTVIDMSEAQRVYKFKTQPTDTEVQRSANPSVEVNENVQISNNIEKKYLEAQIETLQVEREREREQLMERIGSLEGALQKSQDTQKQMTLLLEDQRQKDDGAGEWQKSMKAMESRIANQEKNEKERAEREQKIIDENKRLKQMALRHKNALQAEKDKTFLQRLFG